MSVNQKKSKKKIILICIVILVIVLLILIWKRPSNLSIAKEKLKYINNDEQWEEETVYPEYAAPLKRAYEGELTIKDIGKSMYYVSTEVLPMYYKELKNASNKKIVKYYKKEKESISANLGISNQSQFVKLIEKLQTLNGDTITWNSYRIDENKIKTSSDYTKATLYITYSGNKEISFNIQVSNKKSYDISPILYTAK